MKKNLKKLLKTTKNKKAGVFIDDSNLYHAQKDAGWKVDWKKLKKFLGKHCQILIYNYYVALPNKSDADYKPTVVYLKFVKKIAKVKTKPLKYIKVAKTVTRKGDVDVEIVLDVVRNIEKLDVVFVVSGDSDYLELKNWVVKDKKKNIVFVAFANNMAWEFKYCWHIYLDEIKNLVELKRKK